MIFIPDLQLIQLLLNNKKGAHTDSPSFITNYLKNYYQEIHCTVLNYGLILNSVGAIGDLEAGGEDVVPRYISQYASIIAVTHTLGVYSPYAPTVPSFIKFLNRLA